MKILTELIHFILHFIRNTFLGKFVVITCVITSTLEFRTLSVPKRFQNNFFPRNQRNFVQHCLQHSTNKLDNIGLALV